MQTSCSKITIARLTKEEKQLEQEPSPNLLVKRKDTLVFHFCIFNLPPPYTNGFYHGKVTLPEDYPFSPPEIYFITPNGRFGVDKSICTTFTQFHKNKWSHMWTIRTMLLGVISLMLDNKEKGIGFLNTTDEAKSHYAKVSLVLNLKNQDFLALFKEKFNSLNINLEELAHSKSITPEEIDKGQNQIGQLKLFKIIDLTQGASDKMAEILHKKLQKKKANDRMQRIQEQRRLRTKNKNSEKQDKNKSQAHKDEDPQEEMEEMLLPKPNTRRKKMKN